MYSFATPYQQNFIGIYESYTSILSQIHDFVNSFYGFSLKYKYFNIELFKTFD